MSSSKSASAPAKKHAVKGSKSKGSESLFLRGNPFGEVGEATGRLGVTGVEVGDNWVNLGRGRRRMRGATREREKLF
uniref:Uncharacterized protein n=1 Tax=Cannabis sativa TaxID=3483 RepID=A0A803PC63_CANSA